MDKWVSWADSDAYLSRLSIPDLHESDASIAPSWIQCQHMSIDDELKPDLRYLDIPLRRVFWKLVPGFALNDALARIYAWLKRVQDEANQDGRWYW
jgi:hypothetical protein